MDKEIKDNVENAEGYVLPRVRGRARKRNCQPSRNTLSKRQRNEINTIISEVEKTREAIVRDGEKTREAIAKEGEKTREKIAEYTIALEKVLKVISLYRSPIEEIGTTVRLANFRTLRIKILCLIALIISGFLGLGIFFGPLWITAGVVCMMTTLAYISSELYGPGLTTFKKTIEQIVLQVCIYVVNIYIAKKIFSSESIIGPKAYLIASLVFIGYWLIRNQSRLRQEEISKTREDLRIRQRI